MVFVLLVKCPFAVIICSQMAAAISKLKLTDPAVVVLFLHSCFSWALVTHR